MKLGEKILVGKIVDKHKKVYKGIAILILIPVLPIQLIMFLFSKLGEVGDFIGGTIGNWLGSIRDNIFKIIFYKELPTYQDRYGMTKKEYFAENDIDIIAW